MIAEVKRAFIGPLSWMIWCGLWVLGPFEGSAQSAVLGNATDSTFQVYKKELEQALRGASPRNIALKHLQLGEFYRSSGVLMEATDQYNRALEQIGHDARDTIAVVLKNNLGSIYLALNNFDLARQYFEDAIASANQLRYPRGKAVATGLLGTCFEKKGDYLEGLSHQKESLRLFESLDDRAGIAMTNENIGSIYEDLSQYNLAYEYFDKALKFAGEQDFKARANIFNNLGDIHRKQGNYAEAIKYTQQALQLAEQTPNNDELESANKDLGKAYALMGDYPKAYQYLSDAERYKDLALRDQNARQLHRLQTIYDTDRQEAEIRLLQEQNKVSQANQQLLWVALAAMAIILLILNSYKNRKRKASIKIQEYEQRTLQAELEKKVIEEQNLQQEIQLRTASLSKYSLHISQKNKILLDLSTALKNLANRKNINYSAKIRELAKDIDFNLQQENEWEEFIHFFKELHPEFVQKLSSLSDHKLSPAELRLGVLLRFNLSSKEIASILRITPDSVRVARHRLRKKLPINSKDDLVSFMMGL
ncbi:MAG: transcriptional regulator [Bacteroidota bacterium]